MLETQLKNIDMSTNTILLGKGLKRLLLLLLLMVVTPITLNIGYKALNKYPDDSIWIAYVILVVAFLLILGTIAFGIKTFKILLDALFNS